MSGMFAGAPAAGPDFESGELACPSVVGSVTNVAHGLGVRPRHAEVYLRCLVADKGYAVGQEVCISGILNYNVTPTLDAVNVACKNSGIAIPGVNNSGPTSVTAASWRMIVRAWK